MALDDDIRALANVSLLRSLTQEHLRLLAFGAETVHLPAGRDLYREDTSVDCAYVVIRGRLTTFRTVGGERRPVGAMRPGEVLDEMALIVDVRRSTGAFAEIDTDLLRLNRTLFRRILEEYPDVASALHAELSEAFAQMADRIAQLQPRFDN
ncbi:MAG: cyclic nucleotide-binding domain-containing protein [Mesorhizobium sp.]